MYESPHKFPNNLKLRILENFKKIPEMPGSDGECPAGHQKGNF